MTKVNYFIAGAPKCGTTSMYHYMKDHPDIFMCPIKEPHYFVRGLMNLRGMITSETEYKELFKSAPPSTPVIGEATAMYLYFPEALRRIYEYNPEARIMILLRNPVDMLLSRFHTLRYTFFEDAADFQTAWNLQEARERGDAIPPGCLDPDTLRYRKHGMLGDQIEILESIFPREQIIYILSDDMKRDMQGVYKRSLEFLNLPYDGRTDFPLSNERKNWNNESLGRVFSYFEQAFPLVVARIKNTLPASLFASIKGMIVKRQNNAPIPEEFRRELVEVFSSQVEKLERITGRDLSDWKK
ncbi:MAG: sulfotransferase domain-containing protein [Nitrospinota bacterium]|nr:sulfotransferase domain-containing protein [Nitrospinota bacterium]MDH5678767.1 sulfotransferase domain-containing protein [Nitrospinota bacterium]MDH5756622.1 sulfotransferase domain-containing protein [Nitrospinota bacterium]